MSKFAARLTLTSCKIISVSSHNTSQPSCISVCYRQYDIRS